MGCRPLIQSVNFFLLQEWKNLDMLPNFCYSMALAQFLDSKTDEDFITADEMVRNAFV